MRSRTKLVLALAASATLAACASGGSETATGPSFTTGNPINTGSAALYTLAVIGDTPYGDAKLAELPSLPRGAGELTASAADSGLVAAARG